jgi:hypothetical protein
VFSTHFMELHIYGASDSGGVWVTFVGIHPSNIKVTAS